MRLRLPSAAEVGDEAAKLIPIFTSNPLNDQDNDFLPDVLRERMQSEIDTYFDSNAPPTEAQIREDAALLQLARERLIEYQALAQRVKDIDAQLQIAKLASLRTETVHVPTAGQTGDSAERR